ncbi:MAG: hypothetical protein AMXMBFR57_12800 [Acidimicrobiia bacterium]|jgi:choline-glycine betaine transporter
MTDETWWERNRFVVIGPLMVLRHVLGDSTAGQVASVTVSVLIMTDLAWQARVGYKRRRPHWTARSWRRFLATAAVPIALLALGVALMFWFEADPTPFGAPGSGARGVFVAGLVVSLIFGVLGSLLSLMWFRYGRPDKQVEWPQLRVRPTPQP